MTVIQKEEVLLRQKNGEPCSKIAESMNLSVNTVKSFCRRNNGKIKIETKNISAVEVSGDDCFCLQCQNKITQISGRKPKKFCSDNCRVLWWNSHSENVVKKALYTFTCFSCGKEFTAYGNAKRRYCSHSCYCEKRYGKVAVTV